MDVGVPLENLPSPTLPQTLLHIFSYYLFLLPFGLQFFTHLWSLLAFVVSVPPIFAQVVIKPPEEEAPPPPPPPKDEKKKGDKKKDAKETEARAKQLIDQVSQRLHVLHRVII